jgi:hypothetical protein
LDEKRAREVLISGAGIGGPAAAIFPGTSGCDVVAIPQLHPVDGFNSKSIMTLLHLFDGNRAPR